VIVDAAARLIADEGYDALTMRRLARECGVGVMTLYGYFRTKDELLQALADRLFNLVELPDDEALPWQEHLVRVLRSVRCVFLAHPELLPITATHRLDGTGAYRGAESLFAALQKAGLGGRPLVHAFDALVSFTLGSVQREIGLARSQAGALPGLHRLPRADFPHVIDLAGHLVARDTEAAFDAGLAFLIAGIAAEAAGAGGRPKRSPLLPTAAGNRTSDAASARRTRKGRQDPR
jgi:AcrR family transcriptional regulator